MTEQLVECVPNFSEGRDAEKIRQIVQAIERAASVSILDVDSGPDTNRTVVTFIGAPRAVADAAFAGIARASELIDMREHKGAHPRLGATDVCPFVPVRGVSMDECVALAHALGDKVARDLGIPVYFYEAAARQAERRNLAWIRRGEYERLAERLSDPDFAPDAGEAVFRPRAGATVIGAREFLIAYNITLSTRDKNVATDIAFDLREKGRVARTGNISPIYGRGEVLSYSEGRYPCGSCAHVAGTFAEIVAHCEASHGYDLRGLLLANDVDLARPIEGAKVYRPGLFSHCKAIGWYVEAYRRAQISINLTNFHVTAPHQVLEAARRLAEARGVIVTGSEIVGVVPFDAIRMAGQHYLVREGRSPYVPVADIVETAIFSMGLCDVASFDPKGKILGMPSHDTGKLAGQSVAALVDEVSRDSPAPGGGSMAALAGSLAAALCNMVACLAFPRAGAAAATLLPLSERAEETKCSLLAAVDRDATAFDAYLAARRLPSATPEERRERDRAMREGLLSAIHVPLSVARSAADIVDMGGQLAELALPASISDALVAAELAHAATHGAVYNVLINLRELSDESESEGIRNECRALTERVGGALLRARAFGTNALSRS